ncbi:Glycerophosphodiester phosphodiesterase [Heracleum sosnowskyi]|uniref:glycerophosphodiester phosphodiesterase n=1 Tax=Heracleum sosnowskyi TaxID=360622 RepID=A0AAD8IX07_9APIA|nr:Glycerophosphodiester phosphodiesterase [Heracleum sosnowskyi]
MFKLASVGLLLCLAVFVADAAQRSSSAWKTLSGDAPVAIARGGFSGIFPDSSINAYKWALLTGLPDMILWCDVQLTRDGVGICFPELTLESYSDISGIFNKSKKSYLVNGASTTGWFSVDFTLSALRNISLTQGVSFRPYEFDNSFFQVVTVGDLARQLKPPGLWLNIQHDAFFSQHNLSMRSFVISASQGVIVKYISSPEVNFLRSIVTQYKSSPTKLVFRFLGQDDIEPSTNQTYGSLSKNLTFIKTFSSGILVPKTYIWPLDKDLYLEPHTSVVLDAHKEGLEIFASGFSNDVPFAYDYNYDPVAEYLNFIDNDNFSVDGVLSDFPITPSEAIDCFSRMDKNLSGPATPLVISHEGASGQYPGCTDLAYKQAISDGADILDCPVQMTKDGTLFCLGSINLIDKTTAAQTFSDLKENIPELGGNGIFSFSLNWSDIENLKPVISKSQQNASLYRNPKNKNAGNLVKLSEFLTLANNATTVSGFLIRIEKASYLAEKKGLDVIDAVVDDLSRAGYNNHTRKKVMIQSSSSAVLMKLKGMEDNYEFLYEIEDDISNISNSTILDITRFANSVVLDKYSVYSQNLRFLTGDTEVVPKLQAFKLPVYIKLFQNEFMTQAWDLCADPYVELNLFVVGSGVNGVITDFPETSNKYRRNRCLTLGKYRPVYMNPVPVGRGGLLSFSKTQPPAAAPSPVLTDSDVTEPPFPSVVVKPHTNNGSNIYATAPPPKQPSEQDERPIKYGCPVVLRAMALSLVRTIMMFRQFWVLLYAKNFASLSSKGKPHQSLYLQAAEENKKVFWLAYLLKWLMFVIQDLTFVGRAYENLIYAS